MTKNIETADEYRYTQNRELSWLRFDLRVLEEAADENVPAIERLKFVSIFSTNLDEFFMVRVGSLFDMMEMTPGAIDNKCGWTPKEQLEHIYSVIPDLIKRKERIYRDVCNELEKQGIADLQYHELSHDEREHAENYFYSDILPVLSPQIIDSRHPRPRFTSKQLYIASLVKDKSGRSSIALVPVPAVLPRVLILPSGRRFIRMENIVRHWAPSLYGKYRQEESCIISVTRNADVSFDSEKFDDAEEDFRSHVKKLLKKRAGLAIVRMEIGNDISEGFRKELVKMVDIGAGPVYTDSTPLDMKYVYELAEKLPQDICSTLSYRPYIPEWPADIDKESSVIDQIKQKDRLLFFPFDSVDPFIRLLNEAAERDEVVSIKITIYRLASSSRIVRALCRAAENGKEVVVLMELRARFDEENNIAWSRMLEDAGCKVLYGIENFKCHSKICLITLRERGRYRYITQIGTGNYNEKTNALYTDLSMMTARDEIGRDGASFFRNMLTGNLEGRYEGLLVSPGGIKDAVCHMIDREMEKGSDGYICMKVNSVTDRGVIDKLAEASRAGVEIQLIVRGICCIRAGVEGETDNITVSSIVGRFLEHARIYCFGRGEDAKLYISSADLMTRNLRRRVEIAAPIYDEDIRGQLMNILDTQLHDRAKAAVLQSDGSYTAKTGGEDGVIDSQQEFMKRSIHHAAKPQPKGRGLMDIIRDMFS